MNQFNTNNFTEITDKMLHFNHEPSHLQQPESNCPLCTG